EAGASVSTLAAAPKPIPPITVAPSPLAPVELILVDEADRLRILSLEQLRDLFDRSDIGLVLIGTPGIEKPRSHYPHHRRQFPPPPPPTVAGRAHSARQRAVADHGPRHRSSPREPGYRDRLTAVPHNVQKTVSFTAQNDSTWLSLRII